MNFTKNLIAVALLTAGVISKSLPVFADTDIRTTSFFSNGQVLNLPITSTYVLVDPITGDIKGKFDPRQSLANVRMAQPGLIVIDQPSGRAIATLDPSGKPVDVASVPAINFLVLAIYSRRCDLERAITDSLAKGIINRTQANLLRAETDKVAADEFITKQNSGILTYADALSLAVTINNIGDRLVSYTHTNPIEPLLGSRFIIVNGQVQMVH